MTSKATGVKADRTQRQLEISWADGHVSRYSFDGLRLACPCAECKGGHAFMGTITPPDVVRNAPDLGIQIQQLIPAGAYALQPQWSDGHSAGIFTWELLRALDPPSVD